MRSSLRSESTTGGLEAKDLKASQPYVFRIFGGTDSPEVFNMAPEKDSGLVIRVRKSKGKSKLGCIGCKERKIKCTEERPICSKCRSNGRACVYPKNNIPKWQQNVTTFTVPSTSKSIVLPPNIQKESLSFSNSSFTPHLTPPFSSDDPLSFARPYLGQFRSSTSANLLIKQEIWIEDVMKVAFQNTFLMHALLAFTARHLHLLENPTSTESSSDWTIRETYHLHQSLSTYHTKFIVDIQPNQTAVLGTSFLLAFHACSRLDFNPFSAIPSEDTSFTFLGGVRSIVANAPRLSRKGMFKSIITPPLIYIPLHPLDGPGFHLITLIEAEQFDSERKETYIERIKSLTLYLSTGTSEIVGHEAQQEFLLYILRWQSFCPAEFVSLVKAYDPIALIILAHYYAAAGYAMANAMQKWWWWEKKPTYMVRTISNFLGDAWVSWMEWPNEIVHGYEEASSSYVELFPTFVMYIRKFMVKKLDWDDFFLLMSEACFIVWSALAYMVVRHDFSNPPDYAHLFHSFNTISIGLHYFFLSVVFYVITTLLLRISVSILLLRIAQAKAQILIIHITMAVMILGSLTYLCFVIFQCNPVQFYWTKWIFGKGKCVTKELFGAATYTHAGISFTTDWILGLLPIWLLWKVQISVQRKVGISLLLGMGLLCGLAAIIRVPYIKKNLRLQRSHPRLASFRPLFMTKRFQSLYSHLLESNKSWSSTSWKWRSGTSKGSGKQTGGKGTDATGAERMDCGEEEKFIVNRERTVEVSRSAAVGEPPQIPLASTN
ncbi:hypothetical protein B7494_g5896 [Chlorociboria aeruginascens]|nr:hypothetical protein B7494_g5896 [Chlorociboria aeruginascens]